MIAERSQKFREMLADKYVVGTFSKTMDSAFIEAMGYSNFDFVIIDMEHGPNNILSIQNLIRAAEVSNIFPIVRVKENNLNNIGEVLDVGAGAIQVPQIESATQARDVISRAKFAPYGKRGVCRFVRAAHYSSVDRFDYFQDSNESVVILQIEGQEALDNLNEILDVKGIDVIFIGPYDLAQSLGVSGQINHSLVTDKMNEIVNACNSKGIFVGTFVDTIEDAVRWRSAGVKYLAYSVDVGIFSDACKEITSLIK